ncbi:MAG: chromosome segregation SMC family protein [Nitrososphaerales archaeon]
MVHIRKVEIYGLKSFGYKNTIVNMEPGVVCITGPNGSGKSNILDAVIFALGENSPKALRVDRLQSLFHDQSEGRIHKLVRASVTFDNTDRGIPIDSNTVTITREMPPQGESEYYLNGRKVTKTTITDLLDVVRAAPNRLNVVQQGMIMRVAELNSEERRHIIEDIVGLSYFDEKKEEAMKQLDEADRKLQVAMAKMGEIRKRIDDLEGERNDQLRFQHLERDMRRFKAIKISNSLREVRGRLESQKIALEQNLTEAERMGMELEHVKTQLSQLESEKEKFLKEVDVYSKTKAEVDTGISNTIIKFEQLKANIASSEQRIEQIGQLIPALMKERESINKHVDAIKGNIDELNLQLSIKEKERNGVAAELDKLNSVFNELINRQSALNEQKLRLEAHLKELQNIEGHIMVQIAANNERAASLTEKLEANNKRVNSLNEERRKLEGLYIQLQKLKDEESSKISANEKTIHRLSATKHKIEQQIENTSLMIEKAGSVAVQYETKIKMAKNLSNEDYAVAILLKHAKEFGIIGTFVQLVKWEKMYERAVTAVASHWMKALVIRDVKKMLKMLDHAKEMNFPRLRMIPLDIAVMQNEKVLPAYDGVKGLLSTFVTSTQAPNLVDFIFGDTVLVDNTSAAYHLSREGWRAVTLAGELFEPKVNAVTLDLNSKITDLTKTILLGESVEDLKNSIDLLRQLIARKREEANNLIIKLKQVEDSNKEAYKSLSAIESQMENVRNTIQRQTRSTEEIQARIVSVSSYHEDVKKKIEELEAQRAEVNSKIMEINNKLAEIDEQGIARGISEAGLKKVEINRVVERLENEIREQFTIISSQKAEMDALQKRISDINNQIISLKKEAKEKAGTLRANTKVLKDIEEELKTYRDKEQQLIDTSGNSVAILQEYESKIKVVADQERKLSKEISNLEKDIALNRKEISDLTVSEQKLTVELAEHGYDEPVDGYDVDAVVTELIKEYETLRGSINQLADKTYVQVIDGYRLSSSRKNELESEHTAILRFIEDIEREKTKVFMDAFDKVNKDVRYMFSMMTGDTGSAWLEIENPDDVFNSGLSFNVQFPNKPPRESASLSGGEKTIAATTFLLALQSLKPSPFYLFDEVDAHLDALNTERLSKIIVEKSKLSQMIVVTLKDAIVAKAQMVYGVYPRNGVSQVIKYKPSAPVAK